jgi:hypothetical protein
MKSLLVTLSVAVMGMGMLFVSSASAKAHRTDSTMHTGTVVSVAHGNLVMTGQQGKQHTRAMAKNAKITIDGKAGAVAGLKKGMHVSVTTDTTGNVTAVSTVAAPAAKATTVAKPATPAPVTTPAAVKPVSSAAPAVPAKTVGK